MTRRGLVSDMLLAALVLGSVSFLLAHHPRLGRPGDDELHRQWVGVPAPPLGGQALNGPAVRLDALRGRPVVVVFWETWCAACRRELAHLDRLVREVPEVAVIGVSDEPEETIREFLARRPIAFPMLSIPEPPAPFDIRSIPTNVFIDRKGVIRAVQVASLELEDLEALATGPDYVPTPAAPDAPAPDDFVERWSADVRGAVSLTTCDWDGDGTDELAALSGRALSVLDAGGHEKARVVMPEGTRRVECTALPDRSVRLLAYETWGAAVSVLDGGGKLLWSYPTKGGVDGAHWGDLDGDGLPEMIVGLNGDGGLHAVSLTGQPLWQARDLKNVWNQAVVSHAGGATVAVTQAGGLISVFDGKGEPRLSRFRSGGEYYAPIAAMTLPDGRVQIVAATDTQAVAFDPAGEVAWHAPITASREAWSWPVLAAGDLTGDGVADWIFPAQARPRTLAVHAADTGERRAALRLPAAERAFTVLARGEGKALLVVAAEKLRAYQVK
jgi:peroxiredoxin